MDTKIASLVLTARIIQALSEYDFAYGLKTENVSFQRVFLVSVTEKERKHTFVRVQIDYGFDCSR